MSIEPTTMGEIAPEATLEDCKAALHQVERNAAIAQGVILRHVRDHRLHIDGGYSTFEECVEKEFGYERTWAYRRIDLAETVQMLPIGNTPAITNEGQARAIKPVLRDHGPEVAADVLREAADDAGKVTARSITEATARVIEPEIVEAEVIDDEPVLTSQQWMAREGYTDELSQRRRTEAEREALRAKSKADAIRQRNLDLNVGFSTISELAHPHILDEVLQNWQPLSTDWTPAMLHDLADLLHQIADRWKATA